MLQPSQTVFFTCGPMVQKATFLGYDSKRNCLLQTALGQLVIRSGRVFTKDEASEKGLLKRGVTSA